MNKQDTRPADLPFAQVQESDNKNSIDLSKLREPPFEKDMAELSRGAATDGGDDIRVYRYTNVSSVKELHIHAGYQVIYTVSGSCTLALQGSSVTTRAGDVLIVARGVPHVIRVAEGSDVVGAMLPVGLLKRRFARMVELQSPVAAFISNSLWGDVSGPFIHFRKRSRYLETLFDMLVNEECYPSSAERLIKDSVMMTIFSVLSTYSPAEFDASSVRITRSEQIQKILDFIGENYRTVTLQSLAKHFHYTVPYVSKLIRSATGMTFTAILSETKFDVCRSLLLNSDLKIYQIAEVAGFQNTDHFNRIFKKRTGVTPSDYRKNKLSAGIDNGE